MQGETLKVILSPIKKRILGFKTPAYKQQHADIGCKFSGLSIAGFVFIAQGRSNFDKFNFKLGVTDNDNHVFKTICH